MAFRRPLKIVNGNLQEMTDGDISTVVQRAKYLYINNPSVTLSVVGSGGNLGTINDTRLQAGAGSTNVSRYPTEAETAEPSVVTVGYSRLNQNIQLVSSPVDNGISYPAYYDGSNIRAMSLQDTYDTFIFPALADAYNEVYYIHPSTSLGASWSLISDTPVFSDTGANTNAYTASGIYQTLDQPYTRANFYLFKQNPSAPTSFQPMRINSSSNTEQYTQAAFDGVLESLTRFVSTSVSGYRNRYSWNGSGVDRGDAWDDRLNGSGNYQQRFVNGDDYRAQEFPNGSFVRISTYQLRSRLE
jgi:hypothetical protein